jgi:Ser/Thr protein kinase RdoA (MazF antagonist)
MQVSDLLQVHHSLIAADALIDVVREAYDLGSPITCRLLSASGNDQYLITSATTTAILRVYHHDHYWLTSAAHYQFELDWLNHLHQHHAPVSYPLPQRNGAFLGALRAPEGIRYYALFSFAPGSVRYPLTVAQCQILGTALASIHQASNRFTTDHPRHHFDLAFLLDDAIERIRPFLAQSDGAIGVIETAADRVRAQVANLIPTEDAYGVISGDFHGFNNHFTATNAVTFFDFEVCGYGWRAYDLATFLWNARSNTLPNELWEAVVQGYQTIRPLTQAEQAAIPAFVYARQIWLMGVHTRARERFGDAWLSDFYWASKIQTLKLWLAEDQAQGSQR